MNIYYFSILLSNSLFVTNGLRGLADADEMRTSPDDQGGDKQRDGVDGQNQQPVELNRHGVDVIDRSIERNEVELLLKPAFRLR